MPEVERAYCYSCHEFVRAEWDDEDVLRCVHCNSTNVELEHELDSDEGD